MESVDEDEISAEAESHRPAVCANVMRDVAIQHSIVSFDLNICELVQKRTLTTLRVDRLRDMCIDLGLDISDISSPKRKKASHRMTHKITPGVYLLFQVTDPLTIKAVRVLFTRRCYVIAESYISDFNHSSHHSL